MEYNANLKTSSLFKKVFKYKSWADWERTRSMTLYLFNSIKRFVIPACSESKASFAEAQAKLQLTDQDLLSRAKGLFRLYIIMVVFSIIFFGSSIYHLVQGHYRAFFLGGSLNFVSLSLAFRYHFWYYQIKQRKLGVSLKEWFFQGLIGSHSNE